MKAGYKQAEKGARSLRYLLGQFLLETMSALIAPRLFSRLETSAPAAVVQILIYPHPYQILQFRF
jgi:hypothetical protein